MLNNESRPTAKGNQKVKLFRRPFHAMGTTRNITDVSIHNAIDSLIPPPLKKDSGVHTHGMTLISILF